MASNRHTRSFNTDPSPNHPPAVTHVNAADFPACEAGQSFTSPSMTPIHASTGWPVRQTYPSTGTVRSMTVASTRASSSGVSECAQRLERIASLTVGMADSSFKIVARSKPANKGGSRLRRSGGPHLSAENRQVDARRWNVVLGDGQDVLREHDDVRELPHREGAFFLILERGVSVLERIGAQRLLAGHALLRHEHRAVLRLARYRAVKARDW